MSGRRQAEPPCYRCTRGKEWSTQAVGTYLPGGCVTYRQVGQLFCAALMMST